MIRPLAALTRKNKMIRDDFDPYVWTVEQQRASFNEIIVTELIRDALKSSRPTFLGDLTRDDGAPIYPNLAAKNARLRGAG